MREEELRIHEMGHPRAPSMIQTWLGGYEEAQAKPPAKVRDHPEWKYEKKPWTNWPARAQHVTMESHYLYRQPLELGPGNYANLGTFRGHSTNCLAQGLKALGVKENTGRIKGTVYAVDLFKVNVLSENGNTLNGGHTIERLTADLKSRGVDKYVKFYKGFTHEVADRLQDVKFRFIFVDADHNYETCKIDFEKWSPLLDDDGVIAFHDANLNTVDRVLREEVEPNGWELVDHVWKIKSYRRKH